MKLAGGWKAFFNEHYIPAHKCTFESVAASGGIGSDVSGANKERLMDEDEEKNDVDSKSLVDESGEACEIHIFASPRSA